MDTSAQQRFVGLDVHRASIMVGAVDAQECVLLSPRRIAMAQFADWAQRHLSPTDQVVLEATPNTWVLVDLLQPLVARVVVAHPSKAHARIASPVKTDKRDTLGLARLLAKNNVPEVWIPPLPVRQARSLPAHRTRLVRGRTAAKNRLQALLFRHNLTPPEGNLFGPTQRAWWEDLAISASEQLRLRQDFALIDQLSGLIAETEQAIVHLSTQEPWYAAMPFLLQLPGIGSITGMQILCAIGEIRRFPHAKQLVGYGGLGAKVQASGDSHWSGGITKQGRVDLRVAVIESAWAAVRSSELWREHLERLAQRIGEQKAIVALARKLLVLIWHVLTKQEADRQARPVQVARKLVRWGTDARVARRLKVSRAAFVRQHLDQIGVGSELEQLVYKRQVFDLRAPG